MVKLDEHNKCGSFKFMRKEIAGKNPIFRAAPAPEDFKFESGKNILIAPFASDFSKCYPLFPSVIKELQKEANIWVCYGTDEELKFARKIVTNTKAQILPKMSIAQMIWVIENVDLTIGNDSAISHIAWAQNCRSIILFGNRPSERNSYATAQNIVLDAGRKIDARHINKRDYCIIEIEPFTIIKKARAMING